MSGAASGWRILSLTQRPIGVSARQFTSRRSSTAILAEYHAAQRWCGPEKMQAVWKDRRAQAVTFLMHQLRDARAPGPLRRKAWRTLREVLAPYPGGMLDILHDAGHNKKQTMALLLYQMRLQKLYDLLPVRKDSL